MQSRNISLSDGAIDVQSPFLDNLRNKVECSRFSYVFCVSTFFEGIDEKTRLVYKVLSRTKKVFISKHDRGVGL